MHTLVNRTARELARDYFNGQLSFDEYRDKRRRLIDQVTGIDGDTETPARLPPVVEKSASARDESVHAAAPDAVSETRRLRLPVILLLVIGALGVTGWILFAGDAETPAGSPASSAQTPVAAVPEPVESDRSGKLVNDFVTADDWSNAALADFVLSWSALETAGQDRARSTSAFDSLVEGLRERILEQRALEDRVDVDEREAVLVSFAEHLDVSQWFVDLEPTVAETSADSEPDSENAHQSAAQPGVTEPVAAPVAAVGVAARLEPPMEKDLEPEVSSALPAAVPVDDPCPASLVTTRRRVCRDALPDGMPGPVLIVLPPGGFQMGSSRQEDEQPVHQVQIGRPFAMSAYEISGAQYQRFCRAKDANCAAGHWKRENDPMTNVNWHDARAYAEWLSQVTGAVYRLPTEAEWEYAARAGTTADFPFSEGGKVLPSDARFEAHSPLPVNDKSVNANPFRLRHIMGNVREWVADVWLENYQGAPGDGSARMQPDNGKRVVRGGSYADDADRLRSAARVGLPVDTRDRMTGFRVVREIHK